MAWEWSHTAEAYEGARLQVERLPRQELLTILREWAYHDREAAGRLRGPVISPRSGRALGFRLPNGIRRLYRDTLADLVWERMEAHRTCSNGGWEAYCCPDGCHRVPFEAPRIWRGTMGRSGIRCSRMGGIRRATYEQ